jgi:hypothetical protein
VLFLFCNLWPDQSEASYLLATLDDIEERGIRIWIDRY